MRKVHACGTRPIVQYSTVWYCIAHACGTRAPLPPRRSWSKVDRPPILYTYTLHFIPRSWRKFDQDGSGYVDWTEFRRVAGRVTKLAELGGQVRRLASVGLLDLLRAACLLACLVSDRVGQARSFARAADREPPAYRRLPFERAQTAEGARSVSRGIKYKVWAGGRSRVV